MPDDVGANGVVPPIDLDLEVGPHRYCVPCNIRWRGEEPCLGCDEPGVLREFTDPPGWPQLCIAVALMPGATP